MHATPDLAAPAAAKRPRATSRLLQGNAHTSVSNLFLFPGEFGTFDFFRSAFLIDPNSVAVFELASILPDATEQLANVGIPELAGMYLEEVRRRQPHGPYSLLGHSAGGIIAYEAAQQLLAVGEAVERIYLVDSPCPLAFRPMPSSVLGLMVDTQADGAFSDTRLTMPEKQSASIGQGRATFGLESYTPKRLCPSPGHPIPRTTYYVSKQGFNPRHVNDPSVGLDGGGKAIIPWLFDTREGVGASGDGWEQLVDRTKLKIVPIDGHHTSIMQDPNIRTWAAELQSSYWDSAFPFKTRSTRRRL
ncbi:hypothetical protein HIM_06869 [Hirsutella minnesotensis 3608]|uniref:Thioesterase TesA-like domain-containing protein n=1 Tax=Hirsutella minnesotensis 3608 TaxID=1043627 RepID=A0A0F7ZIJ1_9HYPO|nr:hypothetical protein HIM_06869 [Hirsutella minnesotensis 3608]